MCVCVCVCNDDYIYYYAVALLSVIVVAHRTLVTSRGRDDVTICGTWGYVGRAGRE